MSDAVWDFLQWVLVKNVMNDIKFDGPFNQACQHFFGDEVEMHEMFEKYGPTLVVGAVLGVYYERMFFEYSPVEEIH